MDCGAHIQRYYKLLRSRESCSQSIRPLRSIGPNIRPLRSIGPNEHAPDPRSTDSIGYVPMSDTPRLVSAEDLRRGTLTIYMQPRLSIELKVVSAE